MKYVFCDESGNLDFAKSGTRFFTFTAVSADTWDVGKALTELRHALAYEGRDMENGFHASEDKQAVRDRVFPLIQAASIQVDAVCLDKAKAQPHIAADEEYFYQLGWHWLFRYIARDRWLRGQEYLIVGSSMGTRAKKKHFKDGFDSAVRQHAPGSKHVAAFWSTKTDPCLQIADYCCWAIHRWKEQGDDRSHQLIKSKVVSCWEPWAGGSVLHNECVGKPASGSIT